MAASRPWRSPSGVLSAGALLMLLGGCAGGPEPKVGDRPTEAKDRIAETRQAAREGTAAEIPESAEAGTPDTTPPEAGPQAVDRTAPVQFETARAEPEPPPEPTLYEAAAAERERRLSGAVPRASTVITDANLGQHAAGGHLSVSGGDSQAAAGPQQGPAPSAEDPETYWRTRVRDARLAWRAADDRVAALTKEVARLRFEFYSQDDPAYRDLEIKPAWDRALIDLSQARQRVAELESLVEQTLAEGLEAGALPGWLREGIDFEPQPSTSRSEGATTPGTAQVIEPPILEEPPR